MNGAGECERKTIDPRRNLNYSMFVFTIYPSPSPSPPDSSILFSLNLAYFLFLFYLFVCVCVYLIWWWWWWWRWRYGDSGCSPISCNSSKYRNLFTRLKSYINRLHNDKFQSRFSFSNGTICSRTAENARDTRTIYVANVYTRTQTTPLEMISLLLLFVAVTNLEDSN